MACSGEQRDDEDGEGGTGLGFVTFGRVMPADVGRRTMISKDGTRPAEVLLNLAVKGKSVLESKEMET